MTFKRGAKVEVGLIEGILHFESNYQKYLNKDGSINKEGLHELRSLYTIQFSYDNRKWTEYLIYHLSERTKTKWMRKLKHKEYWTDDEYFNTWLLVKKITSGIKHHLAFKKCKKCNGYGRIFNTGKLPNPKCKTCKGKGEIKIG